MRLQLSLDEETRRKDEEVRRICTCGTFRKLFGDPGEIILCGSANGIDAPSTLNFREIWKGEVCIATEFNPIKSGYRPSVYVNKMRECSHRRIASLNLYFPHT